jgi:hypothetical protein
VLLATRSTCACTALKAAAHTRTHAAGGTGTYVRAERNSGVVGSSACDPRCCAVHAHVQMLCAPAGCCSRACVHACGAGASCGHEAAFSRSRRPGLHAAACTNAFNFYSEELDHPVGRGRGTQ